MKFLPAPASPLWPVTPLGLVLGFEPRTLEWTSACGAGFGPGYAGVWLATCLFEAPLYAVATRRLGWKRALGLLALGNLATHPVVYLALPCAVEHYLTAVLIGEGFAMTAEAWILRAGAKLGWPQALAWSAAANLVSWQLGVLI